MEYDISDMNLPAVLQYCLRQRERWPYWGILGHLVSFKE